MNRKLLHQLEHTQAPYAEIFEEIANDLARNVFDPSPSRGKAIELYINSSAEDLVTARYGIAIEDRIDMSRVPNELGPYESILYSKLVEPSRNVVCVIGAMGCGKTTTLEYLLKCYLIERSHEDCPRFLTCSKHRLFATFNFNQEMLKRVTKHTEAEHILRVQLCDKLRAAIAVSHAVSEEEELGGFWQEEFGRLQDGAESHAFSRITASLHAKLGDTWEIFNKEIIPVRRRIRNAVVRDQRCRLDYLIRLWRYARALIHENQPGCSLIVIDNIDRSSAVVQGTLLDIVSSHAEESNSTWLLLMRPETFDALDADLDTLIVDRVPHLGPDPVRVIVDRLERFSSDPASFRSSIDIMPEKEFLETTSGLNRILRDLKGGAMHPLREFLSAVGGYNIRNELRLVQTLVRLRYSQFPETPVTAHNMIRLLIREGRMHYERRGALTAVENLFRIAHEPRGLLVKARILAYLSRREDSCASIGTIRDALRGFGYSAGLVRTAMNELLVLRRRLIRSNGLDRYKSDTTFRRRREDLIMLSRIGEGYYRHLLTSTGYMEEVMVDALVPNLVGPDAPFHTPGEKLRVLHAFLRHILSIDEQEMQAYFEVRKPSGQEQYLDSFGSSMISLKSIQAVRSSVSAILSWSDRSASQVMGVTDSLLMMYVSLENMALRANRLLLAAEPKTLPHSLDHT